MNSKLQWIWVSLLMIGIVLVYRPLLQDGILVSDDYEHHAARLANYYLALQQGQILPRWAPNLNGGFGYPVFNFTYHVPYLVGTVLHVMDASIQQSLNGSVLFALLFGAIGAFVFARSYGIQNRASWLLALSYMINPYILLTVFWRGALGEIYAYAITPFPLALLVLSNRSEWAKYRYIIFLLFIAIAAILLLSHLPFAIIIFCLIGGGLLTRRDKELLIFFYLALIVTLLVTSWYWLPAIVEKSFTSYSSGEYLLQHSDQFISFVELFSISRGFYSSDFFLTVIQIGTAPIVALIATLHHIYRKRRDTQISIWYLFGVIILSLILIDPISRPLWDNLAPMQMIQFPWRMMVPIHLATLVLLVMLCKNQAKSMRTIEVLLLLSIVLSAAGYAHTKGVITRTDYEWYQATSTTSSSDEHRPIWFVLPEFTIPDIYFYNLQPIDSRVLEVQNLQLSFSTNNGTMQHYSVTVPTDGYLIHKRAYFPGWKATVDQNDVLISKDVVPFLGVVAIPITHGKHEVSLAFVGSTFARTAGLVLTIAGLILLFYLLKRQYCALVM